MGGVGGMGGGGVGSGDGGKVLDSQSGRPAFELRL